MKALLCRRPALGFAALFGLLGWLTCIQPELAALDRTTLFQTAETPPDHPQLVSTMAALSTWPVVSGSFIQTKHVKKLDRDFISRGRFTFSLQDGVLWQVEKPFPSTTVMLPDRMVQRALDGTIQELQASANPAFARFGQTIQAVCTGQLERLAQDFAIHFQHDAQGWILGLVPKDASIALVVDSMVLGGKDYMEELSLQEKTGDTVTYRFQSPRFSRELDPGDRQAFQL